MTGYLVSTREIAAPMWIAWTASRLKTVRQFTAERGSRAVGRGDRGVARSRTHHPDKSLGVNKRAVLCVHPPHVFITHEQRRARLVVSQVGGVDREDDRFGGRSNSRIQRSSGSPAATGWRLV